MRKIIFENPLAPGDIVVSTCAIRDLHLAHPGKFQTDIRVPTGAEQIFENNPYITKLEDGPDVERLKMEYPDIHRSGWSGRPFVTAHTLFLEEKLGVKIPHTSLRPDLHLSQDEKLWPSPLLNEHGFTGDYWIINAGVKNDYTLKHYHRYQEVVDLLKDRIQFVQVGQLEHNHPALHGVLDMRGKTDLRALFRLSYHAKGSVNAVSLQMVIMAALAKPCVVVSGGREPIRWQMSPDHRFLAVNGAIECAQYDGCWKSKKSDCLNLVQVPTWSDGLEKKAENGRMEQVPLCMEMIRAEDIVRAVDLYYIGKMIKQPEKELVK